MVGWVDVHLELPGQPGHLRDNLPKEEVGREEN